MQRAIPEHQHTVRIEVMAH